MKVKRNVLDAAVDEEFSVKTALFNESCRTAAALRSTDTKHAEAFSSQLYFYTKYKKFKCHEASAASFCRVIYIRVAVFNLLIQ